MYFKSRASAGRQLAKQLEQYKNQNVSVVALSEGGMIVGAQIAMHIHANLVVMLTENIYLPGEIDPIAGINSGGTFGYNNMFTTGQIEELYAEYHQFIDQQRFEKLHKLNVLMGNDGEIHKEYLRHHTIILVSDGLANGLSLKIAGDFFKTIAIHKLAIAVPVASVAAVDNLHLIGDDIFCLNVTPNFLGTNHYYEDNTIPPSKDLIRMTKFVPVNWER